MKNKADKIDEWMLPDSEKCNEVFHQSVGLICDKTLKIVKLQKALDVAIYAIDLACNKKASGDARVDFIFMRDDLQKSKQQIKDILDE